MVPSDPARRTGRLVVIHGPMFAGKTTEILARVADARARGERVFVIKPTRDTRYASDEVVTHTGERIPARNACSAAEFAALVDADAAPPALVVIDEVHFFAADAVAPIDARLARGITVVVAGCDIDHFGDLFAPFDALLPRADERLAAGAPADGEPILSGETIDAVTAAYRRTAGFERESLA
ncbi:MAG: hypothetical protein ACK5C3_12105, partial [bacterium]